MMRAVAGACIAVAFGVSAACTSEPPATDPVARGAQVHRALDCASCHEARLFGLLRRTAPALDRIGADAETRRPGTPAADDLRESITAPGAFVLPGFTDTMPRGLAQRLAPADLDALVAYLLSLR